MCCRERGNRNAGRWEGGKGKERKQGNETKINKKDKAHTQKKRRKKKGFQSLIYKLSFPVVKRGTKAWKGTMLG